MSTRANIKILEIVDYGGKDGESKEVLWFYRHCDGYPEGTLPTLKKFMRWVIERKIRDNISQAAGWLVLIGADEYGKGFTPSDGWKCGAYEPMTEQHGDIEFLYTLDITNKLIIVEDMYKGTTKVLTEDEI